MVPVKSFGAAKARLADTLSPGVRAELARWTATRVLQVALASPTAPPVYVACDDPDVAAWATDLGARVCWGPGAGLNRAVDDAVAQVAADGATRVLISHADLVLADPLADLLAEPGHAADHVVLVPDRRRDGTNVVVRPVLADVPAAYGGGSFRRHLGAALATGLPVTVRDDAQLSLDLDTRRDLEHPLVAPVVSPLLDGWKVLA